MSINITTDNNTVKVTSTTTNKVTIVDSGNNTSVSVSQPTTRVIKVATVGPQGPAGTGTNINTGSFATTGSNRFIGNQSIQGDLLISGSDSANSALRFLSGASITTLGSNIDMTAGPGGWSEIGSNNGQNYVWVDDNGLNLVTNWDGNTETSAWRIATGSRQLTAAGDLNMNGHSVLSASNLATTGSNTFVGNQIISGAINTTGTLTVQNAITTPPGQYFVASSDTSTELSWSVPFAPSIAVYSGIASSNNGTTISNTSTDSNGDALPTKTWGFGMDGNLTTPGNITFPNGTTISGSAANYLEIVAGSSTSGIVLWDSVKNNYLVVDSSGSYAQDLDVSGFLKTNNLKATGSLFGTASYATQALSASWAPGGTAINTGSFATTGSVTFTGAQIVTGSTRGNVTALPITSNTASMDLSVGNFFTLQLVQGTNTYINPSNILPGQTSILTISTTGSATVSFPSSIKQPSGSAYVPTTTTGVDILTFASVNSSSLYVVNVKNMI